MKISLIRVSGSRMLDRREGRVMGSGGEQEGRLVVG